MEPNRCTWFTPGSSGMWCWCRCHCHIEIRECFCHHFGPRERPTIVQIVKRGSVGRHLFRNILMIVYLLYSTMTICVIHYQVKGPSLRRPDHLKSWSLPLQLQFFSSVLKYLKGKKSRKEGIKTVLGVLLFRVYVKKDDIVSLLSGKCSV